MQVTAGRRWRAGVGLAACLAGCGGGGGAPGLTVVDLGVLPATLVSRVALPVVNPLSVEAVVVDDPSQVGFRLDPAAFPLRVPGGQAAALPLLCTPNGGGPASSPVQLTFAGGGQTATRDLLVRATFETVRWSVPADALDFGIVAHGTHRDRSFAVGNLSLLSPVTLTSVALPSSRFTLLAPALPITLEPGQYAVFGVRYAPELPGLHDGTCLIGPTDPGARIQVPIRAGDPAYQSEVVFDLGTLDFGAGDPSPVAFEVPADAVSVTVEVQGDAADVFQVLEVRGPGGRVFAPPSAMGPPSEWTGGEIANLTVPYTDAADGQLAPGGGTYTTRVRLLSGGGQGARLRARLERRSSGAADDGVLDLNVFLANALAVKASTAATDPRLATALAQLDAVLRTAGVTLGDVAYYDVTDPALDDVTLAELPALFRSSGVSVQDRVNVFLVQSMPGLGPVAARVCCPRVSGTRASGCALPLFATSPALDLGTIMAHEVGHVLGLCHTTDAYGLDPITDTGNEPNVMNVSSVAPLLSAGQGWVLRRHPLLRPAPGGAPKPGRPLAAPAVEVAGEGAVCVCACPGCAVPAARPR